MTSEEHAHMQKLEGLVKRYRRRIVELKQQLGRQSGPSAPPADPPWERCRCTDLRSDGNGHVRDPHPECPIHGQA